MDKIFAKKKVTDLGVTDKIRKVVFDPFPKGLYLSVSLIVNIVLSSLICKMKSQKIKSSLTIDN